MSVKDDLSQMHDRPVAPPKWSRTISHEQWSAMVDERDRRIAELEAALRAVNDLARDGCEGDDLSEAHGRCVEISHLCAKALSR